MLKSDVDTRQILKKIVVLSGRSAREKIFTYLNYESQRQNSAEFDIPLNRQAFADYIYLDRTTLSTELGKLKDEGYLRVRRNHFVLLTKKDE